MSEDTTKKMNGDSTNPLPLEELVKRQFEALFKRMDQSEASTREGFASVQAELTVIRTELTAVREEQAKLREEQELSRIAMQDRFTQLSGEVRAVDARLFELEETLKDYDDKVDSFVKEQLRLKRVMRELQDTVSAKN